MHIEVLLWQYYGLTVFVCQRILHGRQLMLAVLGTSGSPHAEFATHRAFRALSLLTGCLEAASKEGFLRRAPGLL